MKLVLLFCLFVFSSLFVKSQALKLNITNIRNASGTIRVAFYNSNEGFDDEKALFNRTESKAKLVNGNLVITYTDIKPGTYGIAVLDDENNNHKMDYGLILPKEGFGFSDYYLTGMSKPKYDKFKFVLSANETKTVQIKLRYL